MGEGLVVVVGADGAEVVEPLARGQRHAADLLLEEVVLVQHKHERGVSEARLPGFY